MESRPQGRTIRLFLTDGSPLGIISAEIINWTGKVLSFPRGLLPEALKRGELSRAGVYFLIGQDLNDPLNRLVYVGKSDDVGKRLRQHDGDEKKEFFDQVALFVSKDENLTTSHIGYLENRLINIIRSVGLAELVNGNDGSEVFLPESERSDMEYVVQQLRVLMPVLGLTFLQATPKPIARERTNEIGSEPVIFELSYLKNSIVARAYESDGRMVVLEGSRARHPEIAAPSLLEGSANRTFPFYKRTIEELIKQRKLVPVDDSTDSLRFAEDVMFASPSAAASLICGASKNGKLLWKVEGTGQTYGEWREEQMRDL